MQVGAIIVAAGSSARMEGVDKLFAPLGGQPLLARGLAAFQDCAALERVVLVLSPTNLERGRQLITQYGFDKVAQICPGGPRRQDSVRCGLEALGSGCQWVVIHDGARPFLTPDLIQQGLAAAQETGAAVPALPLTDTIKEADTSRLVLHTLDRRRLWAVQTPQVFHYPLLHEAHRLVTTDVTDDAAMLETLGHPVKLFPGSPFNIKITTPEDLLLAEAILRLETRNSPLSNPSFRVASFDSGQTSSSRF